MKVISLLNLKGGVAKTFTAVNMAYELYRRGYKVLLLDNDKQGNLSKAYGRYDAESVAPITKLLSGEWQAAAELIQRTDYEGIDIVSANMSLMGATWQLTTEETGNQIERYKRLAQLDAVGAYYDFCIIDNPPDIGLNVVNALTVTDEVIVPVKIDEWALEGLDILADQIEITGKLRDIIAELMNESPTNIARMDSINNNATPEIKEEFAKGNIGVTTAYEAAKLPPEEQKAIAEKAAAGENVRAKEIAAKVAEKKAGDSYETPHPESITSLCYSCKRYKDCNVKTGTCEKCDQYINKAEAEKTDEQRYSDEQDKIDRDTKKKLQERADRERMESLPSDGKADHKTHEVKIASSYYEDIISGKKKFELRKNDRGYKVGDSLKMLEFDEGKHTGRTIDADIIYMLEDYTGLEEGYCILGIDVTEYSARRGQVSETDTGGGRPAAGTNEH